MRGGPGCAAEIGQTWRAGPKAGSVAGQIVTCVGASRSYQSDEDNEDMGDMRGGGWTLTLYVRPATEEASAPVLAAEQVAAVAAAEVAARTSLLAELTTLVQTDAQRLPEDQAGYRPAGRILTIRPGVHGSGVEVAVLAEDGTVSIHHGGHYDDYRCSLWTTHSPRAAEIMAVLLGGAS